MSIRLMTIDDYEQVYELWMSCAGMGLNNLDDSKEGIEKFLRRNPDTCFVADVENVIIGVIIVGNDGRRGYIYHTAVHPQYRKQGVAKSLVDTAMTALQKIGISKAALVVFDGGNRKNTSGRAVFFLLSGSVCFCFCHSRILSSSALSC